MSRPLYDIPSVEGNGSGAGAGEEEEECAICLEVLVDPLAPCAEQPSHRYCRTCVQEMQRKKLPSCPLCRGKMQDGFRWHGNPRAVELFYEAVQLRIRAKKAPTPAKQDALYAKEYAVLHRVLRVDLAHVESQFNLGLMYAKGEGVQQDFKQAAAWLRKAADQGLADAQYVLGMMYFQGEGGVQQDFKQGVEWLWKAADQGMAKAQFNVGIMYKAGNGVQQDFKQAAAWYQKAAEQGLTRAQFFLAMMYEQGEGVQQDFKQAAAWYQKAAEQGDAGAQSNLSSPMAQGAMAQNPSECSYMSALE
jgi:TPR repeat protein